MFCSVCNRCALAKLWFQIVRLAIFRVNGVLLTGVSLCILAILGHSHWNSQLNLEGT